MPISVGFQSGSHYATIQALEPYLAKDQIKLSFGEGMLFSRMEAFFEGKAPAATLFGGPYYFAEQLGYRKIIDTTFMIGAMVNGDPDMEDVRRYFQALAPRAARHRPAARALHPLLQDGVPRTLPRRDGYAALGARRAHRVRALQQAKYSTSRSTGSPSTRFSRPGSMGSGDYDQAVVSIGA